jgi:hypothetical protein
MKAINLLVALLAAAGAALGGFAYFAENTGVTGSGGALTAFLGAVAVALGALLDLASLGRGVHVALRVLIVVGAGLTAFAAFMLLQYVFTGLMLLAGLVALALFLPGAERRPA